MKLNHKIYGKGDPVIILHGLLGSLANWQTMSRRLAGHFKVFAIDQRNHGSSPHSETFNYEVMTDDLHHFMNDHRLSAAHLIGHSMGGKTAMRFALTRPERVARLVVVDIAPKTYPPRHDQILDTLCSLDIRSITTRKEADEALAATIPESHVRQFLLMNLARNESGGYKWKINLSIIRRHYDEIRKGSYGTRVFEKPALFLKGALSSYIQREDDTRIKTHFPHARIEAIQGAGHWLHADAPDAFFKTVRSFLTMPFHEGL